MKKIPTLFERDWEGDRSRVTEQVHDGCEWVLAGEGNALRKFDGTCVMFDGKDWWARREVKEDRDPPAGFVPIAPPDETTGKSVGWEPIGQSPFAKFHAEAVRAQRCWDGGTYELIGPKVQGNPERVSSHRLIAHATADEFLVEDRTFAGIEAALARNDVEGFVFHHPDGRMAKIKKRDFGLARS